MSIDVVFCLSNDDSRDSTVDCLVSVDVWSVPLQYLQSTVYINKVQLYVCMYLYDYFPVVLCQLCAGGR